jgi:hypothetical protein
MEKLGQALGQLRAVGAHVTVIGNVRTVAEVRELAVMAGEAVKLQWLTDGRILEWFKLIVDGAEVTVQAARPAGPVDFELLNPAVRS